MREILFRGKQIYDGEWVKGDLLQNVDCLKIREQEKDVKHIAKSFEVVPDTVGQYTGLTDKNGTKIFEGDIVKYGDTIHKVVFEQRYGTSYFGLVYSEIETLPFGHYQDLRQIEIVGNIHDNPELLGGE